MRRRTWIAVIALFVSFGVSLVLWSSRALVEAETTKARSAKAGAKAKSFAFQQVELLDQILANQEKLNQRVAEVTQELQIVKIRATSRTPQSACP